MDIDREKDVRSYDPMELLRERTMESEKYRDNRYYLTISLEILFIYLNVLYTNNSLITYKRDKIKIELVALDLCYL